MHDLKLYLFIGLSLGLIASVFALDIGFYHGRRKQNRVAAPDEGESL